MSDNRGVLKGAQGKGGSGRGGSASWGYVAGLVGSGSCFAALAASLRGVAAPERHRPYSRKRSLDGRALSPARGSVPAEQPRGGRGGHFVPTDSPEPGGAAGRGCGAAVAALGGTGRRHRRGFPDEAVRRSPLPSPARGFPTPAQSSGLRTPGRGVGRGERDRSLGAAGGESPSRSSQWRRRRTTCFSSCS